MGVRKRGEYMAFEHTALNGKHYFLHSQQVKLKGSGVKQTIYYFGGKKGKYAIDDLPAGYKIIHSKRTGLPLLKKK